MPPTPRRRRWALAVAAAALSAGVVGGVFLRRRAASAPAAGAPVTAPERLSWPTQARAWTVHRDADGGRRVVFGPLRFSVSAGGGASVAAVRFEATIIASVPVASGWVFVTADGGVAASEDFLGAPRALGRFPCAFKVARDSVGRAVVLGEDGSLWTTDGTAPLARSRLPAEARAATFMDGSHGAAVLRDGRVMLTADAGQRWDFFALDRDVAWGVSPELGGVAIETTRGREVFRWEGAGAPGHPHQSRPPRAQEPRDAESRLRPFINGRYEIFQPAGNLARCAASTAPAEPRAPEAPRRYVCHASRALRPVSVLPLPWQPNVDATDLLSGTESGPVRARLWRRRPDVTGETFVRLTWMGVDEGGVFHGVTAPSGRGLGVHWPIQQRGPLRVEAVSRRGALVLTHDRPSEPVLAWGTAARDFVRVRDPFVEQAPAGMRSLASGSREGGVVVVFAAPLFEGAREAWSTAYAERGPQVGAALRVDASGAVIERRGFIGDDPNVMMLARSGASEGPVVRDLAEPPRWRMLPLDGVGAPGLPAVRWDAIAACGAARADELALTVAYPPIALDRPEGDRESLVVSRAELEGSAAGGLCVRAISLGGRRLRAAPGDRFEGALRCEPATARP
ncbi:MAG: hypothetical protein Q7V43_17045 [Myxococcales bacterium]|nr:hypothetical protein [Myxococcales bacterium]